MGMNGLSFGGDGWTVEPITCSQPFLEETQFAIFRDAEGHVKLIMPREQYETWQTKCEPKFGIMHPSDRALGLNYNDEEVWGADDRPVLFDTIEEARAHITERITQYPKSDWRDARVVQHTPGVPEVYPQWEDLPEGRT